MNYFNLKKVVVIAFCIYSPLLVSANVVEYVIGSGDTLYSITKKFNVDMKSLMVANNIDNPSDINAGKVIFIPNNNQNDSNKRAINEDDIIYKVSQGDTLLSIASNFNVNPRKLALVNLESGLMKDLNSINEGQILVIPQEEVDNVNNYDYHYESEANNDVEISNTKNLEGVYFSNKAIKKLNSLKTKVSNNKKKEQALNKKIIAQANISAPDNSEMQRAEQQNIYNQLQSSISDNNINNQSNNQKFVQQSNLQNVRPQNYDQVAQYNQQLNPQQIYQQNLLQRELLNSMENNNSGFQNTQFNNNIAPQNFQQPNQFNNNLQNLQFDDSGNQLFNQQSVQGNFNNQGFNQQMPIQSNQFDNQGLPMQSNNFNNQGFNQQSAQGNFNNQGFNQQMPIQGNQFDSQGLPMQSNNFNNQGFNQQMPMQGSQFDSQGLPMQSNNFNNQGFNQQMPMQSNQFDSQGLPMQSNNFNNQGFNQQMPVQGNNFNNQGFNQQSAQVNRFNQQFPVQQGGLPQQVNNNQFIAARVDEAKLNESSNLDWKIIQNNTLKQNLDIWATRVGWQLVWELPEDYELEAGVVFQGTFFDAVKNLVDYLVSAGYTLKFTAYKQNKVLRVSLNK